MEIKDSGGRELINNTFLCPDAVSAIVWHGLCLLATVTDLSCDSFQLVLAYPAFIAVPDLI